jgi:hypothetical protein
LNLQSASSTPVGYSPAQVRAAYGFNTIGFANGVTGNGAGQTIAIVVAYHQPNISADLHAFDLQFGLADPPSFVVATPQGASTAPPGNWGIEASLDVEWAHALAPGAGILLVEARSAGTDLYAAVDYARQQPGVSVVSMSWGSPEFSGETSYDQYFATPAGHTGVTFVAACGDKGAPGNYPAFSPNVLAVGGTMFSAVLDAQGHYPGEVGWSGSGGGLSQYENQPSYQKGVVTQSTTARAIPDVSFDANSGVAVYDSYDFGATPWISEGGTSLAAPAWAALIATADQGTSLLGQGTLDSHAAAASLYNLFSGSSSFSFNDVTSGNNGFPAGTGYDLVTGLGTPKAAALAVGLSGNIGAPTPTSPGGALTTTVPTFQWSAVAGAVGYHLVAIDQTTQAKTLDVNVTGATSYTPSTPTFVPGKSYKWQVQADPAFAGLGAYSGSVSFSIAPVSAPTPMSPADGSTILTHTPTFTWSATAGAAYYGLTVYDETAGVVALSASQVSGTTYTATTSLVNGHVFRWFVQAYALYNGVPYASQYSASATFSVVLLIGPTLLEPVANAIVTTATPTFKWAGGGAGLTIFDLTANVSVVTDLNRTTGFTLSVPLVNKHRYRWSVTRDYNSTPGTAEFTVSLPSGGTGSIAAPTTLSGPSGIISTTQPTFQWSAVPGATGYGLFIFQGRNSIPDVEGAHFIGWSPVAPINVTGTSYTPPQPLINFDGFRGNPDNLFPETPTILWYVVAYDSAGNVSAPSASRNCIITLPSPGSTYTPPTLTGPSGTVTTFTPTFTWTGRASNFTFDLIDETSNALVMSWGETLGISTFTLNGTNSFVPQALPLYNGHNYRWYVETIVEDPSNTLHHVIFGGASTLTFTLAVPQSGAPTPIAPAANASVNTTTPTFRWTAVTGANKYLLVFSDLPGSKTVSVDGNTTSYTPSQPLVNGATYQWQVLSFVTSGSTTVPGPGANAQSFTVDVPGTPSLTAPKGTVATTTPTFQWSAVTGATGYELYLRDTTTSTSVIDALRVTGTSYTPGAPLANGHAYKWYVLAFDNSGNVGLPPDPVTFTTSATLGTPNLFLSGQVNTAAPTFQWSAVPGAAGYRLTIRDTTTNTTYLNALPVTGTSYTLAGQLVPNHTYQWSVAAFDSSGNVGGASDPGVFSVFIPGAALAAPAPSSPSGAGAPTVPSFRWSAVPKAASYQINVIDSAAGTLNFVIAPTRVSGTSYTPAVPLALGHPYEWQVLAFDSSGNESAWSDPVPFTTVAPAAPAFTSAGTTTFAVGTFKSFTVSASGVPSPALNESGTLPNGVTFDRAAGVLAGTPAPGSTGTYHLTFTAANGVGNPATQSFSLIVTDQRFNFDKLGAYRPGDGSWSLDSDGTFGFGPNDQVLLHFSPPAATGVAGDWTHSGRANIGDFSNGVWHLDLNGNGALDPGETFTFGQAGDQPVVGDWTGDGKAKLGVFRAAADGITGEFILDVANHKAMDASNLVFTFGLAKDRIVVGDWTGDGIAKVGVFRDATAFGAPGAAVFSLDVGNHHTFDSSSQVFVFGLITDGLVVGDWNGDGKSKVGVYRDGSAGFNAPGVALFSLDTNGNRQYDPGVDAVFLYGFTSDQFVGGNWNVTPPLLPAQFAAGGAGPGGAAPLTEAELAPVLNQAIADWAARGADVSLLAAVPVRIGPLGGSLVGWTDAGGITLSPDAAGWGWFVDPTPARSEEFTQPGADGLRAPPGGAAAGRMDLLTVLEHELGHELGLSDFDAASHPADLMAATLATGVRRQTTTQVLNAVFATLSSPQL